MSTLSLVEQTSNIHNNEASSDFYRATTALIPLSLQSTAPFNQFFRQKHVLNTCLYTRHKQKYTGGRGERKQP